MNAATFSAAAALAGSAVGRLSDFIDEASRLYTHTMTHDSARPTDFVGVHAKISKMRFMSSPEVIASAEKIVSTIIETYSKPNRDTVQMRAAGDHDIADPLQSFSEMRRAELRDLTLV
ncbi:hypothetical protein [Bradyrhizobium sp. AZCC 2289]|uniref:hypothetical protein n=1 Tax=Bradyrhizobium sp. AZCC 2289 TaxID=3117026 RepID=UPI002FF2B783